MIIPFREILRRAGARLQNTGTSTSNANDLYPKLKDWCQERYERAYESFPWLDSLEDTTLTIIASQLQYGLDRDIGKLWAVYDQTNGRPVKEKPIQSHIRFYAEDLDQTGNIVTDDPRRYMKIGKYTVKTEIGSSAEKVKISSTVAGDITPNVVHITGLVSSAEISEDIVANGTTEVVSSNTYDASQKLRVNTGTSDATRKTLTGVFTIAGNTSGTTFAVISPHEYAAEYTWIQVSPKPKSTGTQPVWLIWYQKRLQMMINDNDIPIIDIGSALVEGVVSDGLREDGQEQEAIIAEQKYFAMVQEKMSNDTGPNLIEQFVPEDTELISTLDYGRVIGGNE